MAGGRSTNTMSEVLVNMLRELSVAKTLPDSDLQFLVDVETIILQKLRQPLDMVAGGMAPGAAPTLPPMGAEQGMMEPMMPMAPPVDVPVPPPPGEGPPGLRAQPPMPSPDELQRLLTAGQ
jgi:hypothetical protein